MTETRPHDVAAIKGVLESHYKAWDAGDADAFVTDYAEDATVIMPGIYTEPASRAQPTFDVGAKAQIYKMLTEDAANGTVSVRDESIEDQKKRDLGPKPLVIDVDDPAFAARELLAHPGLELGPVDLVADARRERAHALAV